MVTDALADDLGIVQGIASPTGLDSTTNSCSALSVIGGKAYLAGPPPMVAAAAGLLRSAGMAETEIHADDFRLSPDTPCLTGPISCSVGRAQILPGGGEDIA
jgi:ferredoxin-NADP reductase